MRPRTRPAVFSAAIAASLALTAGCGDGGVAPPELASLNPVSGNGQFGVAGRVLPAPLVVEAKDGSGQPTGGVTLQFSVTQGGGQLDQTERKTDSQGRASVSLTLGSTPGAAQQVTVSESGSDISTTFSATATSPPAAMSPSAGNGQSARSGVAVPVPPAVRVVDNAGQPVAGVSVQFQVTRGGGSLTGAVKLTGADGVAAADAWTMGPTGVNVVEATADAESLTGEPAVFVATTTPAAGLDIVVRFSGSATAAQLLAFANAEVRWESLITNDLSDALVSEPAGACGDGTPALNENLDDLLILASVQDIDGPGSVLAQAGPCLIRDDNGDGEIQVGEFPGVGVMMFDEADLELVEQNGVLEATVLHEMGHVLGFGVLWELQGLLADPALPPNNGVDPHFTGAEAITAFDAAGGTLYLSGAKVPVEDRGGPSTANAHWRDLVFDNEVMTGFVNVGPQPLSAITVASFASQGYTVNFSGADPYTLPLAAAARAPGRRAGMELGHDIARIPIRLVGPGGRVTRTIRP